MLDTLLDAEGPLTVPRVAELLGQHVNTVREHLDALVRAGLVTRGAATPHGRGRPAAVYRPTAEASMGGREYAVLAEVLVEHLAETWPAGAERRTQALHAGERWGRAMIRRGLATADEDGHVDLAATFTAAGFDPEVRVSEQVRHLRLRRCPVLALAQRHSDVVCTAHLGMARELAGVDADVELAPFAAPGACLLQVRR